MTVEVLGIDAARYVPHPLHTDKREWAETNCYVDLWIEVLGALGLDPVAAAAFTLSSDFDGEQWEMFKYPTADLRVLFGVEIAELNVWRPLIDHVVEHLGFGRLVTVDVDAWFLPDTEGVTYRDSHQKTTIAAQMVDVEGRRLGYFHNAGYFELEGDDFDGILRVGAHEDPPSVLPPYVEIVKLDRIDRGDDHGTLETVRALTKQHLGRRPTTNPIVRMQERLRSDLSWLSGQDFDTFHRYAFGTCRQCGSNAELAASFVDWLDDRDGGGLADVADRFRSVSSAAKGLQIGLARAARGRHFDVDEAFVPMASAWDGAMASLVARYGG